MLVQSPQKVQSGRALLKSTKPASFRNTGTGDDGAGGNDVVCRDTDNGGNAVDLSEADDGSRTGERDRSPVVVTPGESGTMQNLATSREREIPEAVGTVSVESETCVESLSNAKQISGRDSVLPKSGIGCLSNGTVLPRVKLEANASSEDVSSTDMYVSAAAGVQANGEISKDCTRSEASHAECDIPADVKSISAPESLSSECPELNSSKQHFNHVRVVDTSSEYYGIPVAGIHLGSRPVSEVTEVFVSNNAYCTYRGRLSQSKTSIYWEWEKIFSCK